MARTICTQLLPMLAGLWMLAGCTKTTDLNPPPAPPAQAPIQSGAPAPQQQPSGKKGLGLSETIGRGKAQLAAVGASWYYNWRMTSAVTSPTARFIPMLWGAGYLPISGHYPYLLGFNEPDKDNQANMPLAQVEQDWPQLSASADQLGGPATFNTSPDPNSFLSQFMDSHPRVDFITVHWYKGADAGLFIANLTAIYQQYHLPIWVTEFAPQTIFESQQAPEQYSQQEVNDFMRTVVPWMNSQSWVARYAWHDSRTGTSALFNPDGSLTATGVCYASL